MKRPSLARVALAAASAAVVATVTGFAATGAGASAASADAGASAATVASAASRPGHGLPQHVFAPYFETYNTSGDLAALSQQSGARYLSLAFLETDQPGSCTAYWNGATSTPVASSSFGADIAAIQARGGNVIPSFGGFTADTTNTDIADSCTSVSAIAQVYENVITTYHVPRIDLDVEGDSVSNTAGINRRNEAIAQVEAWAAAHGRRIQFSYTLPSLTTGLDAQDEAVLQNAIADGARISVVNLLTFDYFIGTAQEMATDTVTAADGLHSQLEALYPQASPARLWRMVGVTEMPGIDDFGPDETFTQADAATIIRWAQRTGIGTLSFWALQRDNGTCPGTKGAGACSGLTQPTWYFSHVFEPFTRWW
jgi:Glycosyl hydrolases family 18